MKSKNYDIKELIGYLDAQVGEDMIKSDSTPLIEIYKSLSNRSNQLILECGVRKGYSTTIFTHHSELTKGECYSVDIEDCSDVVSSDKWFFHQADDTNQKEILSQFSKIQTSGIDILYIDSLHTTDHVKKVLYIWFPYLNKNSLIFIDDIDSFNYSKGNSKDNVFNQINWEEMNKFTIDFARSNRSQVSLIQYYSKSGLAKIYKYSEKGSLPSNINSYRRFIGLIQLIKAVRKIKSLFN